jgi:autotransporter strand-loop-strand O-heptosyltransferase
VGCFDNQPDKNPNNWRTIPLQQVATDILGLEYIPLRAKLKYESYCHAGNGNPPKPYICFSEFSTMRNKLWNREGAWQEVIGHLNSLGYDCVCISAEQSKLKGIVDHCGQSIEQTLTDISGASFYVGLNAGPTWLAYSLGIPIIMITGVSEPFNDPPNPYRIQIDVCRPGCFNDPNLPIDRGWDWCPRGKDFACTREITTEMVIEIIGTLLKKEVTHAVKKGKVRQGGIRKHKGNDDGRTPAISSCSCSNV